MNPFYRVYTSGYMTGYSFNSVCCWRQELTQVVTNWWGDQHKIAPPCPIKFFSPLRGERKLLGDFAVIPSELTPERDKMVIARDHWDVIKADLMVCNLKDATRVSIGSVMEIAWAFDRQIPIVFIMDEAGCFHDHTMIRGARMFRVDTVEQAAYQLLSLLALTED